MIKQRINLKPLSVNACWKGRRFKTPDYKAYEQTVLLLLAAKKAPTKPYKLKIEFGVSSKLMDIDNPVKPFIDILQKKYGINDRDIIELNINKLHVKKGKEYINFELCNAT